MRRKLSSVLIALAVVATACSSDDKKSASPTPTEVSTAASTAASTSPTASTNPTGASTGPNTAPQADGAFCTKARDLAEYNGKTPDPDLSQPFETVKTQLVAAINDSMGLYDDAIAEAPSDIRSEIEILKDTTTKVLGIVRNAGSQEDMINALGGLATPNVGAATTKLDTYLRDNCGFGLTS